MTRRPITSTSVFPVCDGEDSETYLKRKHGERDGLLSEYLTRCSSSLSPSPALIPLAERRHSFLAHPRRATSLSLSVRNADAAVRWGHTAP